MPFFDFPVAHSSDVEEDMVEASRPAKKWARIVAQRMKEKVVDTLENQVACLEIDAVLVDERCQTSRIHTRAILDHQIPIRNMLCQLVLVNTRFSV